MNPNIVYFLVDDMGYGDVSCLNPHARIATPQFDRLAREGMVFRDAHSSSAVCSPSRYGVLTGRYNWRSTLQQGIVAPYGPPLIDARRLTVGKLLQRPRLSLRRHRQVAPRHGLGLCRDRGLPAVATP